MLFCVGAEGGSGGGNEANEALPALQGSHGQWHSWVSAWEVSPVWGGDWSHLEKGWAGGEHVGAGSLEEQGGEGRQVSCC